MPTFNVTETRVINFRGEDGSPLPQKAFRLAYDIPDAPEITGHAHIIPFAAVANYQLEEGGGTVEEAIDFFIRERMQVGYEQNQIPTARGAVATGAAQRDQATRERLKKVNGYVRDLAVAEAEIGLPATAAQMMELVAEDMIRGVDTGASLAELNQSRSHCQGRCTESLVDFTVDKASTGWGQLKQIASSLGEEMKNERARQVEARWGPAIRQRAWMTHLRMTGS